MAPLAPPALDRNPMRRGPVPAPARAGIGRAPLIKLLAATLLFALGPAILKLLTQRGAELGLGGGAISFCNVLFVGNLCAGLTTLAVARPGHVARELRGLPRRALGWLALAALVSTIYPALLFTALEQTTVTNIVLLSRFNGIVYVLIAWLLLRETIRLPQSVGYAVIALGVAVLVLDNNAGSALRTGDLLVLLAALFFALTEIISRKTLPLVSIHTYVFVRNFVSALLFFSVALVLFGPEHFMDAFRGGLWVLMTAYALFAIVAAQFLWLGAVRVVPAWTVADVNQLNPVFSLVFAFFLLGEVPAPMQWLVIAVIAAGMLVPRLWRGPGPRENRSPLTMLTGLVGK